MGHQGAYPGWRYPMKRLAYAVHDNMNRDQHSRQAAASRKEGPPKGLVFRSGHRLAPQLSTIQAIISEIPSHAAYCGPTIKAGGTLSSPIRTTIACGETLKNVTV